MTRDTIYFISDQHLGRERDESLKLEKLLSFFDFVTPNAASLYIVGDFFDFYFEYKTQISKRDFRVLSRLSGIVESGIKVYYFVGNHDFWVGDFFQSIGVSVYRKGGCFILQGKKVYIAHSSKSFDPIDLVLRNRLFVWSFYLLHPDLAYWIGSVVSRGSRINSEKRMVKWSRLYRNARTILKNDIDAVIFGHIHIPTHKKIDGKDFILIGDWIHHFSYVTMRNGKFSLHSYQRKIRPNRLFLA